jgi:hypothetical protein
MCLANVVMVKKRSHLFKIASECGHGKKNEKWRMCTDFTDLNKCCLKKDFSLARINKIVDSAASCEMMVLLNCILVYHQICFHKEDEEKTNFIILFDTYCYM